MASVIKDIGEIWTRLFDHRPFIQGEVTFFLREFQDKRNEKEVLRLLKVLEYSSNLKNNDSNCTEAFSDYHLLSLKANVNVALSMCDYILQKEIKFDCNRKLIENRKNREYEIEEYRNNIKKQCAKIDQELQIEHKELQNFYANLTKKLNIST